QAAAGPPGAEPTKKERMRVWQLLTGLVEYAQSGRVQHKIFVVTASPNAVKDDREQTFDSFGWTVVDRFRPNLGKDEFVTLMVRASFPQFFHDAPETSCAQP